MFLTTLPMLFGFTHLISPLELGLFFAAIMLAVFIVTPDPQRVMEVGQFQSFYQYLRGAWEGQVSLWKVFWPFFILVNLVLIYADYRIENVSYTIGSWKAVHFMIFLPIVWWTQSIWRGSALTRFRYWAVAARTVTVLLYFELLLRFIICTKFPHLLFDCRILLIEYGDC